MDQEPPSRVPVTLPPGTIVVHHQDYPPVPVPSRPCLAADLSGAVTGLGPYIGMGNLEVIVTIDSTSPCFVEGYPTLSFSVGGSPVPTAVQDGGEVPGTWAPPSPVAVGSGAPASFEVHFFSPLDSPASTLGAMTYEVEGSSPGVPVAPEARIALGFAVGNVQVSVTPFEQGDSLDQYA